MTALSLPFFFCYLLYFHRCITARVMRIDGPRALNFLHSVNLPRIRYFSPMHLPAPMCIECRFQMLVDFTSATAQGCKMTDDRSILINAGYSVNVILIHIVRIMRDKLVENRPWYALQGSRLFEFFFSCTV